MYGDNLRFESEHSGAMDFGPYGIGLGASITPTGSQLVNVDKAINWGLNNLEVTFGTQMSFQQQGHLAQLGKMEREELIRLAKINRVNLSLHAPHFDASGMSRNGFSEDARNHAVQEFKEMVKFADQIGINNNTKHIPIVIHGTEGAPSSPDPNNVMSFVNRDSGEVVTLQKKRVAYDENFLQEQGLKEGVHYFKAGKTKEGKALFEVSPKGEIEMYNQKKGEGMRSQYAHSLYWQDVTQREEAKSRMELERARQIKYMNESELRNKAQSAEQYNELLKIKNMNDADFDKLKLAAKNAVTQTMSYNEDLKRQKQELNNYERRFEKEGGQFVPTEKYAKEQAIKTIVDVAKYAAETKSEPKLVIENIYPEYVMGNPEFLASTIKEARKTFVKDVTRSKSDGGFGMNTSEAERKAKDIIGINFDIGHANMWKRYGKMPEVDKDGNYTGKTIKVNDETIKNWASMLQKEGLLKHVHIADNFGDYDAHLPVGLGNAPINKVMDELKKEGFGQEGQRAIMETFGMVNYGGNAFGVPASLYGMSAPLVSGGADWEMAAGSYFSGGYPMTGFQNFPDVNFQMYGVGFGGLPYATGGNMPGKDGKFSSTPMS